MMRPTNTIKLIYFVLGLLITLSSYSKTKINNEIGYSETIKYNYANTLKREYRYLELLLNKTTLFTGTFKGGGTNDDLKLYSDVSIKLKLGLSNTISTSVISGSTFCQGASISVPYTITDTYISGNVFTAQLSNSSGSFASPVNIGTLTSVNAGTISATIPIGTNAGNSYRIRVVSSNPEVIGSNNSSDLTIVAIPTIISTTPNSRCGSGTVNLNATASAGLINWYENSTGGTSIGTGSSFTTPSISTTTIYWVDATLNGCTTTSRTSVTATINKNYWTGASDTDWNNPANWCAGVPTFGADNTLNPLIPSGLTNYPTISSGSPSGYVKTLVIEPNTTLTILDNSLRVTEYLKLDGKIDLEGEAQLLQDLGSILDPSSSGTLERDQQGIADTYTYNYWASPVGFQNNSTNNNSYKLTDVFKNIGFLTSGYNGSVSPLKVADYWIWKFNNKLKDDYASWQQVRSTGTLLVGEGFSMKGPGTGTIPNLQNYVFEGKPNNGDINLTVTAGNDYLVGNPYPSALDADQFILDNEAVLGGTGSSNGTLYFWQHWGGGSHTLKEYQGGYAVYTLAGGIPSPFQGIPPPGLIKRPGRYIPVAQGFFVTAETSGTIKFNNSQRVFQIENGINSLFVKDSNSKQNKTLTNNEVTDTRIKLRLGFKSINTISRQLLVTADPQATTGFDRGYDAPNIDNLVDDMYWMLGDKKYTIQAINSINESTIIPLGIHTKNAGFNTINIDALENAPHNLNVFVHDKTLNVYHDLKQSNYNIYLASGNYLNRFEITFSNNQSLSTPQEIETKKIEVVYSNENESIIVNNPNFKEIKSVKLSNILGQIVYHFNIIGTSNNFLKFKTKNMPAGAYIITLNTDKEIISKKVLIK